MPLNGGKYRYRPGTKIRLHFTDSGQVDEVKNTKTGKIHSAAEFAADRKKSKGKKQADALRSGGK